MLKPTKHLNPKLSVLNVSSWALKLLAQQRITKYDDLYNRLYRKFGDDLRPLFLPSLNFLYLLGKLEYHPKTDAFEYKDSEAI